jgi:hypothetical protein
MRTNPAITGSTLRLFSGTLAFSVLSFDGSLTGRSSGAVGCIVASGLTAGQGYYLQANNSTSAYIDYTAEL